MAFFSKGDSSSWSAAFQSFSRQLAVMVTLGLLLISGGAFYGMHELASPAVHQRLAASNHLLKVGSYPTFEAALGALERRVPGRLKTFPYSADTTVWFGRLALFGAAFPDARGIIRKEHAGYTLYEED
ncbi:MAG: hypothetical protein ACP5OS_01435 [Leptospirillia bacterium]